MLIIGFIGKKGSGKTTASDYVQSLLNRKLTSMKIPFKSSLVAELKRTMHTTLKEIAHMYAMTVDDLFVNKPPVMRALMQNYGTEVRRGDDKNYWVNRWKDVVKELDANCVIVDDVRFINEANAIKEFPSVLIRVIKDGQESGDKHESELEQDNIEAHHVIIAKDGDHDHLYSELKKIVDKLL